MIRVPYGLRIHRFLAPKKGSQPGECEDAIAFHAGRMVFAVADGATEAYDSRSWARLFVRAWVRIQPPVFEMQEFEAFVRDLGRRLHRKWSKRQLPWYAEEKVRGGSFAAFVILHFYIVGVTLHWKASALGDCCLIHRRNLTDCNAFPLTRSEEFGSHPILLPSIESKQRRALDSLQHASGAAAPGDDFLLVSDAVGSWFLKQRENGEGETTKLFDRLTESNDADGLQNFFGDLRSTGQIRNDDIAVVRIEVY